MSRTGVKSFTKAPVKQSKTIPGTKLNPNNFSLLTSCGLQALDTLLGGGLPVGSLLLIEEDESNVYAETIAKCFISEGILCKHRTVLAGKDADFQELLRTLPGPANETEKAEKNVSDKSEMSIAWRYENLDIADTSIDGKNSFGHKLALNTVLEPSVESAADIVQCSDDHEETLMSDLSAQLTNEKHRISDSPTVSQILRIALLNLGSPLWEPSKIGEKIYLLRSWLRQSLAVGLITIPTHLHPDHEIWKWIHFSDICIRFESFAGTHRASNPALKDYHGFLHIVKLPAFNSIAPHCPPSDLAFRLRRRTMVIERLSLPPELDDTSARETSGCGTVTSRNLDF